MSEVKENAIVAMAELLRHKLSGPAIDMFIAATRSLTDDQFCRAATLASQSSRFFPSPAELLELARTGGVSYQAQAELAWGELERALEANKPSLMSPAVAAVARQLGGFQALHATPLEEFRTWKRKDFLATFEALVRENPERLAALAGPRSSIGEAFGFKVKKAPGIEELRLEETANRKRIKEAVCDTNP